MTFARKTQEHRERRAAEREVNLRTLCTPTRSLHKPTYTGTTAAAQPKTPHQVNPAFRLLAKGEACTGLLYGGYCHCDPATTVLAHTNTQADQKGMGYKAHDFKGAFLGFDCHAWLDQGKGTSEERSAFMVAAQARTVDRLREIANSPTLKPWRRITAQTWLECIKNNEENK